MKTQLAHRSRQLALAFVAASCVNAADVADQRKSVTLARHETVAEFRGIILHKCMGLTSLCPDKCGHSGSLATFRIVNYLAYEKLGEYGDPKTEEFAFLVEDNMGHPKVTPAIRAAVSSRKKGDIVLLSWNHDYVTVNGTSGPERPVTKLEKLADVGTREWLHQIDRRAGVRDAAGHGPTIGSDEWSQAVSRKLGVFDNQGHGPTPNSAEWQGAIQWKAFGIPPGELNKNRLSNEALPPSMGGAARHEALPIMPATGNALTPSPSAAPSPDFDKANKSDYSSGSDSVRWVKREEVQVDLNKMRRGASRITKDSYKPTLIASRGAAVRYLNTNVNMAEVPRVGYEDENFYYFSGGTRTYAVSDFSTGFAIDKVTGEIFRW